MGKESYDIQKSLENYIKDYPDKEIRIINAAINAFAEKGFEATTTKEIAKKAGVAEGTFFHYFATKESLLEKMVPLLIKIIQPKFEKPIKSIIEETEEMPLEKIFSVIILDRLKLLRDNQRFIKSVLPVLIYRASLLNQLQESILPKIKDYMDLVLKRGKSRGEIRDDMSVDIVMCQMLGFVFSYAMFSEWSDELKVKEDIELFIKFTAEGWRK